MHSVAKMMRHVLIAALLAVLVNGAPRSSIMYADDKVQDYLMRFGYLPQNDFETGNLRTEDQLRDAIKTLQKFGGIPVTGEIDEATKGLMKAKRCGLPDQPDPRFRTRHKRFTIHGQQWQYRNLTWRFTTKYVLIFRDVLYIFNANVTDSRMMLVTFQPHPMNDPPRIMRRLISS